VKNLHYFGGKNTKTRHSEKSGPGNYQVSVSGYQTIILHRNKFSEL